MRVLRPLSLRWSSSVLLGEADDTAPRTAIMPSAIPTTAMATKRTLTLVLTTISLNFSSLKRAGLLWANPATIYTRAKSEGLQRVAQLRRIGWNRGAQRLPEEGWALRGRERGRQREAPVHFRQDEGGSKGQAAQPAGRHP